jgi:hypothetical protein
MDKKIDSGEIKTISALEKAMEEYLNTNESVTNESAMSDIDIMAQEAKDFKSFVKEFKKEFKNMDAGSPKELETWLQTIYDSAKENMDESKVNESHFAVGDKVKCIDSGKTGEVVKLDKEHGTDDEKYYTVKVDDGGEMKYAPDELELMESKINEGKGFKSTKNFEDFLEEIDGMGDYQIKKIMGKDYIDTPGYYSEEAEDYDNDIIEFMISNMGRSEFEKLKDYWENNVAESKINESATDLIKYVIAASEKTFKGGGNGQNLLDNAMELASHIGDYQMGRPTRGYEEDGFYGPNTVTAFKKLVDQMSADDIKNNQADKYESLDVNEGRSINKIQKDWSETTTKMQQKAGEWKAAEGDRKSELLDEMKALTAKKRALETELDAAVAGKDRDLELVVSEGNAFGAARAKAIADGEKEFEFEGETYKVEDVGADDKENAKEFVEESKLTMDSLLELFEERVNEDIRSDVKKFIKNNANELNALADKDEWDLMYAKLYNEFNVEPESTKGKDLLKTFQFVF